MLHSALDRAVKERLLIRNPADSCVVPKVDHQEMKTLRPEDPKAYLNAAEKRGALAMFYLELVSGIRKGELAALQWTDLDAEQRTISVSRQATKDEAGDLVVTRPKTENSILEISIPQKAVELLVRVHAKLPGNPWLFSSRTWAMYHPDSGLPSTSASSRTPDWSISGSTISATPSPPWPSRTAWTSRPSPLCWAATTPGSR